MSMNDRRKFLVTGALAAAGSLTAFPRALLGAPAPKAPLPPSGLTVNGKAAPVVTTSKKWHPGFGVVAYHVSSSNTDGQVKGTFDNIKNQPNFNRGHLIVTWRDLEPTQGKYDFSILSTYRDYINNVTNPGSYSTPKYLSFEVWFMVFGTTSPNSGTQAMPQYVIDNGWYYVSDGNLYADLRIPQCLAAFQALHSALGAKFDSDPWIEGVALTETAGQQDNGAAYLQVLATMKKAFPHTNVVVLDNYAASGAQEQAFVAAYTAMGVGGGGPDVLSGVETGGESFGQLTFRGAGTTPQNYPNVYSGVNWGSTDYRGKVPNFFQRQGVQGSQTLQDVINYVVQQKATHVAFSPGPGDWSSVVSAVNAHAQALNLPAV
jgi:hypothetical protein